MAFSKLQKIGLSDAVRLLSGLEDDIHSLAREHGFVKELCTRDTKASQFNERLNHAKDLVQAVLEES